MGVEGLSLLMFVVACGVLILGFPVAFSLAGTGLAFALLGNLAHDFDLRLLGGLASRYFGIMVNEVLVAVPMFVFMGVMLERAKIAEQLLETMGLLFGRMRGGLALSVIFVGMVLAASTGIVGATVVTMGLLSLPSMIKAKYDPRLACGVICASGTLGQIIPPSVVLVLLGDMLQGAYAEAQRATGNWAPAPLSVIDLFAGAILPGMLLVGLYMTWVLIKAIVDPAASPALVSKSATVEGLGRRVVDALLPPAALMFAVLGSILAGIATPTEAAAVGCIGALLLSSRVVGRSKGDEAVRTVHRFFWSRPWALLLFIGRRLDNGSQRSITAAGFALCAQIVLHMLFDLRMGREVLPWPDVAAFVLAVALSAVVLRGLLVALARVYEAGILAEVMRSTTSISSMVFVILLGASVFSLVFRGLGGDRVVAEVLNGLPGGAAGAMVAVMAVMFVLGFFLDFIEIIFVVVPIVGPILLQQGIDPLWFGIMIAINLQTSFLTPPFGFALFYLRGVAPPSITTLHIYRGVVPFVCIQLAGLAIVALFPQLVTWLPRVLFR
ncbi:MAG: TRAP transporter large permease subunit [Rhodospirillales bacterium]|nr:TRAP transporter large permease subunit [Rhodospirillales bacterium]